MGPGSKLFFSGDSHVAYTKNRTSIHLTFCHETVELGLGMSWEWVGMSNLHFTEHGYVGNPVEWYRFR